MDILELLSPGDIFVRIRAEAKRPLLRLLADHLAARAGVSEDAVLAALLGREILGSTGTGHGIAVPHALLKEPSDPAAVLAVLERPLWFSARDEQPAHIVLAVIWPRGLAAAFTLALSRVCRLLSQRELRESIRRASSSNDVIASITEAGSRLRVEEPLTVTAPRGDATRETLP